MCLQSACLSVYRQPAIRSLGAGVASPLGLFSLLKVARCVTHLGRLNTASICHPCPRCLCKCRKARPHNNCKRRSNDRSIHRNTIGPADSPPQCNHTRRRPRCSSWHKWRRSPRRRKGWDSSPCSMSPQHHRFRYCNRSTLHCRSCTYRWHGSPLRNPPRGPSVHRTE